MSWNSYPKQLRNSLLKRLSSKINKTKEQTVDDRKKIWLNLPYLGDKRRPFDETFNSKINQMF